MVTLLSKPTKQNEFVNHWHRGESSYNLLKHSSQAQFLDPLVDFFFFLKDDSAGYGKEHKGKAMEMMKSLENKTHEEGIVDLYFHTEMKKEV